MSESDQHQYKDRYMLRMPDGLRDRIKSAAEASNRSMNAEIVALLEEHYPAPSLRDEQAETFLLNWVINSRDQDEMVDRAGHANKMLQDTGKNVAIRVLDEIGAKVLKAPAVLVITHPIGSDFNVSY